jgi:hypothetical protein
VAFIWTVRTGGYRPPNMATSLDSQQVEILGRAALIGALIADELEVARPERDAGIDLIAFTTADQWKAVPIQMKAALGSAFSIDQKYERIDRLVMAYVWNVGSEGREAVGVADGLGWTSTESWKKGRRYATSRPSAEVGEAIACHRMKEPGAWRRLLESM